jgi:hypothetical protein
MVSRTESTGSVPPGQGGPSCSVRLPRTVATNAQLRAEREHLRGEPEGRRQDQADPQWLYACCYLTAEANEDTANQIAHQAQATKTRLRSMPLALPVED